MTDAVWHVVGAGASRLTWSGALLDVESDWPGSSVTGLFDNDHDWIVTVWPLVVCIVVGMTTENALEGHKYGEVVTLTVTFVTSTGAVPEFDTESGTESVDPGSSAAVDVPPDWDEPTDTLTGTDADAPATLICLVSLPVAFASHDAPAAVATSAPSTPARTTNHRLLRGLNIPSLPSLEGPEETPTPARDQAFFLEDTPSRTLAA